MKPFLKLLRWLLVIPAAAAGWAIPIGIFVIVTVVLGEYCPGDAAVSGACTAGWFLQVEIWGAYLTTILSVALMVAVATRVAPGHKQIVGALLLLVGLGVEATINPPLQTPVLFVATLAAGFLALRFGCGNNSDESASSEAPVSKIVRG